ncbi:MAG: glycine cleavage system protein GcvH [Chloroflexota bacterium]
MNIPTDRKYTKNDEWIQSDGTVGISDYAQDQLSDVVYVEIAVAAGDSVNQGDTIGTIESVKAAADVYAPVSGTIAAINEDLSDKPETVNGDPYGAAWLIKIEIADAAQLDSLMDAAAYEKYCAGREH